MADIRTRKVENTAMIRKTVTVEWVYWKDASYRDQVLKEARETCRASDQSIEVVIKATEGKLRATMATISKSQPKAAVLVNRRWYDERTEE